MIHQRVLSLLYENRFKIEGTLVATVLVTFLIFSMGMETGDSLLMLSMSVLAVFYFLSGQFTPETASWLGTVATKIVGIGSSVCVIAILFAALNMPGAAEMLDIGMVFTLTAGSLVMYFWISSKDKEKYIPVLVRVWVLAIISVWLVLILPPAAVAR